MNVGNSWLPKLQSFQGKSTMKIEVECPAMPEEEFNKLKAFVTRYIIAYSEDVSQPKPLARYIDSENDLAYPEPPYKEISQ